MALQSRATRMARTQQVVNNGVPGTQALTAEDQMRLEEASEAIESMNPALRAVFDELKDSLRINDSSGITFFYQIGTILLPVKEDRRGLVYGKGGYRNLCKALDYNVFAFLFYVWIIHLKYFRKKLSFGPVHFF